MDNHLFEMLIARFDSQDATLKEIKDALKEHVDTDNGYWKKIDIQEGQLSLLRKLIMGAVAGFSTLVAAIWAWLTK